MLPDIDMDGQERLQSSQVLVVGLGGLGAPAAMYLAAAGVGELAIADFDEVDLSNLQRQIIHTNDSIGQRKVDSAYRSLTALNPDVKIIRIDGRMEQPLLSEQVSRVDVVVDASDNFATRFALNAACVATGTPLVSGAAIRMEGQVSVFPGKPGGPCYRCLYPDQAQVEETCSQNGVLAPVVGIIGSIQATEAIKVLTGAGTTLVGRLLLLDARSMEWNTIRLRPDPDCPVCAPQA